MRSGCSRVRDQQRGHGARLRRYSERVPRFVALPMTLRLAGVLGALEAIGFGAYALSIIGFELTSSTSGIQGSDLAPSVLVGLFLVFAALIATVTFFLMSARVGARTPFLLIQAFGIVIAETLYAGDGTRALAIAIGVASVMAGVLVLTPSARQALQ